MKKIYYYLFLVAGLVSCAKEKTIQKDTPAGVPMTFNISVAETAESSETRALKTDWKDNDVIYLFFKGMEAKHLTLFYRTRLWDDENFCFTDSPGWEVGVQGGDLLDTDFQGLSDHTLTAVYFPEEVEVNYADNQFRFTKNGKPVYNYYLLQTGKAYKIDGTTVSAVLKMKKPDNFVQFHIPGTSSEVAGYKLSCPQIQPVACKSVGTDGVITEDTLPDGTEISGVVDDDGGIFSGRLVNPSATDYTFTLADRDYYYILTRNSALSAGKMYNFPVLSNSRWSKTFKTVAGLKAFIGEEPAEFTGVLKDAVISFIASTADAIVKDNTGSILYHNETGHGLIQGQVIDGDVTVNTDIRNGIKEITDLTATVSGDGCVIEPEVVTLAQLDANYAAYESAYVKVVDVTSRTTTTTKGFIECSQEGTFYNIYTNVAIPINAGEVFTAEGTVEKRDGTEVLRVWMPKNLVITTPLPFLFASPESMIVNADVTHVNWSITSNTDWTITPGSGVTSSQTSGNGNADVTLYFAANIDTGETTYTATVSALGCQDVTITISQKGAGSSTTISDKITAKNLSARNTTYADFSNVAVTSVARYAGNSAKDSSGNIMFRSKNQNSGIVSTFSGGIVKSVTITVDNGYKQIDVYGNTSPYSNATDLYPDGEDSNQGTLIGSLTATGTIEFPSDAAYPYIGIRSHDGAVYLSMIEIVWE